MANLKEYLISMNKTISVVDNELLIDGQQIKNIQDVTLEAEKRMREHYKEYFKNHFENLVILTGAGSSIGIGKKEKTGKTRIELWKSVKDKVSEKKLKTLCEKIKLTYPEKDEDSDIELMLTRAYKALEFISEEEIVSSGIKTTVSEIEKQIRTDCFLELPLTNSPHEIFLSKVTIRKLKYPRVKLFTLNYDTLFEQAANKGRYTLIDGFSFTVPRTFSGLNFDYDFVIREKSRIKNEENYVPRVFHLYKPHGSLDWEKSNEQIFKREIESISKPLIIYPQDSKYESSYEQPFFEMMSRFQQAIRTQNVQLICIGFSFYDKHFTNMIKEAIESNPSFNLCIVSKDISSNTYIEYFKSKAQKNKNIIIIDETFDKFSETYPYPKALVDKNFPVHDTSGE